MHAQDVGHAMHFTAAFCTNVAIYGTRGSTLLSQMLDYTRHCIVYRHGEM